MCTVLKTLLLGALLTFSIEPLSAEDPQAAPTVVTISSEAPDEQPKTQKLIHVKSNFTLVEFIGQDTVFHDRILEKEMTERGVLIPPALRGLYNGKEAIRLGEEEFQRAFKEIFSINIFDSSNYAWE